MKAVEGRESSHFIDGPDTMRLTQCGTWLIVVGAATVAAPSIAASQANLSPVTVAAKPESVTVAAGARYQAGALRRWLSGDAYRDLWTMPIRVPVLDRHTYVGGLHPTKEGGG